MPEAEAAPDSPQLSGAGATKQHSGQKIGPLVWWLGFATSGLVAGSLSLLAYAEGLPTTVDGIPQVDKMLHFTIGGMLAFFLDGLLRRRMVPSPSPGRISVPLAAALILVPAAIEEFFQRFSPNRSSSFADFAADVAGVALGVWFSRRVDPAPR